MNNRYDEIINLPHHISKTRPQMPMSDRAAQFAPFAALTGYDSAIKETGRLTDERIELDEGALTALNMRYQLLMDALDEEPEVEITYFKPDERKAGGAYVTATGAVIKVDDFERLITMQDGTKIPMDDLSLIHICKTAGTVPEIHVCRSESFDPSVGKRVPALVSECKTVGGK